MVTADGGAPCLQGVMRYKAVVVPTCTNLAANTLKLLEEFVANGAGFLAAAAALSGRRSTC